MWTDLWAAVQKAGPFASMLLLFILYIVNEERKKFQEKNETMVERLYSGLNEATNSIRALADLLRPRGKE